MLVNSGGSGFFRVRYDQAGRDALAGAAADLTPLERYGLVDDAWASLLGGSLEVGELLRLLRAGADETDLSVWQRIVGVLGGLDRIVADADRPALQSWVRALVGPALLRLGPDPVAGESSRDAARRATLFATLGTLGADPDVALRARGILDRADAGGDVDADLLDAAVRVLAAERRRRHLRRLPTPGRRGDHPAGAPALPRRTGGLPRRSRGRRPCWRRRSPTRSGPRTRRSSSADP